MRILGIDPGVKNTGVTLVEFDELTLDHTRVQSKTVALTKEQVDKLITEVVNEDVDLIVIEKFVHYHGKSVDISDIARRIGWLEYAFWAYEIPTLLVKAVEWQTKILAKFGQLPKAGRKFKLNARKFCLKYFGLEFKTEHEADAFLIAYYGLINKKEEK